MPFARFPGVDTLLGPEMRSTGEVMGLDASFARAFLKSQIGAGTPLPDGGTAFISVKDDDKETVLQAARMVERLGFDIVATGGTCAYLNANGVAAQRVNKVYEGGLTIVDRLKDGHVQLVWNTTEGAQAVEDSRDIRAIALYDKIPYFTTAAGAQASAEAIRAQAEDEVTVRALQA